MIQRLQKRLQKENRNEGGFTLVELLVVIAILGILAGVVVFAVGGIDDKGQDSACEIDARTIRTAQEAYFAQNSSYAANEAALVPDFMAKESTLHDIGGDDTATTRTEPYTIRWASATCGGTAGDVVNY